MINVPIKELVYSYIDEANLTMAQYARLYRFAVRGAVDLGLDITQPPITVRLDVSANKTVEIPDTIAQWTKIGVLNQDGEVATLFRNTNLTTYASTDPNRLSMNTDASGGGSVYNKFDEDYHNFYTAGSLFRLFGAGHSLSYAGEMRVDVANNLILLDNDFPYDYVILEGITNPASAAEVTVPLQAQEALISFLRWKDIESMPSGRRSNLGEKQLRRKEYYNQRRLARERMRPVRMNEINDSARLSNSLTMKP